MLGSLLEDRYYRRLFDRSRSEIVQLLHFLQDDRSREVLRNVLLAYTHQASRSRYLGRAYGQPCEEAPYVLNTGTKIREDARIYFPKDVPLPEGDVVWLDGGAYTGDTLKKARRYLGERLKEAYAFEPDDTNFERLRESAAGLKIPVELYHCGLDDHDGAAYFQNRDSRTRICMEEAPDRRLLRVCEAGRFAEGCEERGVPAPTRIKLDIEGREKEVLLSMSAFIRRREPDLLISIYHHPEDLWQIPLMIRSMDSRYRLYIRHHSDSMCETVCYAFV